MDTSPLLPIPFWTPELGERFAQFVPEPDPVTGCQLWAGNLWPSGYGAFYVPSGIPGVPGVTYRAHRVAYAWAYGDTDFVLDHVCHVPAQCVGGRGCQHRRCVNPEHLDPVSVGENSRRGIEGASRKIVNGNFYKQSCAHGHEFTPENTYVNPRGERQCRVCLRDAQRRYAEANHERVLKRRREKRDRVSYDPRPCAHCLREFTPERSTGKVCPERDCVNSRQRLARLRRLGREDEFVNEFL